MANGADEIMPWALYKNKKGKTASVEVDMTLEQDNLGPVILIETVKDTCLEIRDGSAVFAARCSLYRDSSMFDKGLWIKDLLYVPPCEFQRFMEENT